MSNRTAPAAHVKSFGLSDSTVLDMKTGQTGDQYPRAFIPDVDGTLSIELLDETTVAIPVKGGAIYPIVAKKFRSTGTVTVTTVIGLL